MYRLTANVTLSYWKTEPTRPGMRHSVTNVRQSGNASGSSKRRFGCSANSRLVLGLYRKRDGARRLHEHGVLARFRYNDLKEAARAADAGLMQIQWWEGAWPSCAEAVPQSATRESISPKAS